MKKFWIRFAIYLAAMVGIAWLNNAALLHFHPLAYYYTPAGMMLAAGVTSIKALIVWPLSAWYLKEILAPAAKEGLKNEIERSVK